jgi:hypothetical protein
MCHQYLGSVYREERMGRVGRGGAGEGEGEGRRKRKNFY